MGEYVGEVKSGSWYKADPNIKTKEVLGEFDPATDKHALEKARALAKKEAASMDQDTVILSKGGKIVVASIPDIEFVGTGKMEDLQSDVIEVHSGHASINDKGGPLYEGADDNRSVQQGPAEPPAGRNYLQEVFDPDERYRRATQE